MRWLLVLALSASPAFGAGLNCAADSNVACDTTGCGDLSMMSISVEVDYETEIMTACGITGCRDFPISVESIGSAVQMLPLAGPPGPRVIFNYWPQYGKMVSIDQYALVVQIAYFSCAEI